MLAGGAGIAGCPASVSYRRLSRLRAVTCGSADPPFRSTLRPTPMVKIGAAVGAWRTRELWQIATREIAPPTAATDERVDRTYEMEADCRGRQDGSGGRPARDHNGRQLSEHNELRRSPLPAHRRDHDGEHQLR